MNARFRVPPRAAFALGVSLAAAAVITAPGGAGAQQQEPEFDGPAVLRERYFQLRQHKPDEPNFDRASGRLKAMRERKDQEKALQASGGKPNLPAWLNVGPAPLTDGQTPQDFSTPSDVSGRVNAIEIDPVMRNRIWAGTDVGVYVSVNGGNTWVPHNTGLAGVAVFDLKANAATNQLVAFTHGRSAYLLSPLK